MQNNGTIDFDLCKKRMLRFLDLLDMYFELLKGNVRHSRSGEWIKVLIEIVYSYFYSIIDDRADSVNMFRVWRIKFPSHEAEIERVEKKVIPYRPLFKSFRNRVGFHGSINREDHTEGLKIFRKLNGRQTLDIMLSVRNLSTHLLTLGIKDKARLPKYICSICN